MQQRRWRWLWIWVGVLVAGCGQLWSSETPAPETREPTLPLFGYTLLPPTLTPSLWPVGSATPLLSVDGISGISPLAMYLADDCTLSLNLAGLCGISIPCGQAGSLPIGLQVLGRAYDESTILRVAHAYEQATEWHLQCPHMPVRG